MSSERELDQLVESLLSEPAYYGHPLREALARLQQQNLDQLSRLERIARISDGYQSLVREQNLSLSERYHRQLRQLEKVARISDRYQDMLRDLNQALKDASQRDVLTGLANRRLLMERLREEELRSQRSGRPFVLAMLDVDHFKQINDGYGHEAGDLVLQQLAILFGNHSRGGDYVFRLGGEEFLVVLVDINANSALGVAEKLRRQIEQERFQLPGNQTLQLSVSIGLALHDGHPDYQHTLRRADEALYAAKHGGRNRVVVAKAR